MTPEVWGLVLWLVGWVLLVTLALTGTAALGPRRRAATTEDSLAPSECSSDYDVVIPLGPKDSNFVYRILPSLFQNVVGLRHVYLVSAAPPDFERCATAWRDRVRHVPELRYPFGHPDVLARGIRADRSGWYRQQLYKLYAYEVIPSLSPHFVTWDADTFLLTPQRFFLPESCVARMGTHTQYHPDYFQHMARLHPMLQRQTRHSGICNFMAFHAGFVREMMDWVESRHAGRPFWQVFLDHVDKQAMSGASEFEMYFNFMLRQHPEAVQLIDPPLRFENYTAHVPSEHEFHHPQHDLISVHWYLRPQHL